MEERPRHIELESSMLQSSMSTNKVQFEHDGSQVEVGARPPGFVGPASPTEHGTCEPEGRFALCWKAVAVNAAEAAAKDPCRLQGIMAMTGAHFPDLMSLHYLSLLCCLSSPAFLDMGMFQCPPAANPYDKSRIGWHTHAVVSSWAHQSFSHVSRCAVLATSGGLLATFGPCQLLLALPLQPCSCPESWPLLKPMSAALDPTCKAIPAQEAKFTWGLCQELKVMLLKLCPCLRSHAHPKPMLAAASLHLKPSDV